MKYLRIFTSFIIFFTCINYIVAQTSDDKIKEVYGELNGQYFKGNIELYNKFKYLLENRIKIEEITYELNEKFQKISSFSLNNKYNSSLKHEFTGIDEFNPLKYNLDFFTKTTKVYRIDETNYVLIINPQ